MAVEKTVRKTKRYYKKAMNIKEKNRK